MSKAYSPRATTVDLIAEILARPGVARVHSIAPHRSGGRFRSGGLRITLEPQGANPKGAHSDFTLPEARAWLAADIAQDAPDPTPSNDGGRGCKYDDAGSYCYTHDKYARPDGSCPGVERVAHDFRPMTTNRTRCDVCGRTAGVATHRAAVR